MKKIESSTPVSAELVPTGYKQVAMKITVEGKAAESSLVLGERKPGIEWRNVSTTNGPGRDLHEANIGFAVAWIWRDALGHWRLTCNAVLLTGAELMALTIDEAKIAAVAVIADFAYQRECSFAELRRLCT